MRKSTIRHEHLRKLLEEIETLGESIPDETFGLIIEELKYSYLIVAGDYTGDKLNLMTLKTNMGDFGMLFTDMDEFRKVFPDFEVETRANFFKTYLDFLDRSNLLGYVINFEGERFVLSRELLNMVDDVPSFSFPLDEAYSSSQLKELKDSINNESLEEFIKNPQNIGKYEELFDEMSSSTLLTLMLSRDNLENEAVDGVISMDMENPSGFLHVDSLGGSYATVYTSEDKISNVATSFNKYSQIVNFSHMTHFILNDDMDGIIINPGDENIMLSRNVLLRYSSLLDRTCNDSRLNAAIMHMFPMQEDEYC